MDSGHQSKVEVTGFVDGLDRSLEGRGFDDGKLENGSALKCLEED